MLKNPYERLASWEGRMPRSTLSGAVIAIILGLVAGLVLGAILGGIFELILYLLVTVILSWIASVIGYWIFGALAGLFVGGIIGGILGALIGLLLHPRRWSAAFHTIFYSVLGAAAAWIAFTRYGVTFGGTLGISRRRSHRRIRWTHRRRRRRDPCWEQETDGYDL